jgi:hypothetical protein
MTRQHRVPVNDLANLQKLTRDVVTLLVAEAVSQAHVAARSIEEIVIPILQPQKRGFAIDILRRMNGVLMCCDKLMRDLESFMATLEPRIEAGTTLFWQADEYHIEGGYVM